MIIKRLIVYSYNTMEVKREYKFNTCGLNVILGERKEKGQETNGVGKTTMVESINYLLGGSCPTDFKGKVSLTVEDIFLILEVKKNGKSFYLGRLLNQLEDGFVLHSTLLTYDLSKWDLMDEKDEYKSYINDFFSEQGDSAPSFSALREYIIRDEKKGFIDIGLPNRSAINESKYFSYLFGLPHDFEYDISKIKKEQKDLNKKLALINSLKSEIGDLKLKEERLNKEIRDLDEIILNVKLTDKLKKDANEYSYSKEEYNKIQNSIFELEHIKKQYEININDLREKIEEIKVLNDLESFYEQLIGYFPKDIKKNHEQIQNFYNFMVDNRGEYFRHKIEDINNQINEETKELNKIGNALAKKSLAFINTDIISDFSRINEEKNEKFEELAELRVKINLYQEKTEVTSQINKLKKDVLRMIEIKENTYSNYKNNITGIETLFNEFVNIAYGESGVLEFELNNKTGINNATGRIEINCQIDDEKSHGRLYMKINMFDLTWFVNGLGNDDGEIPFLIHDGSYSKPDKHAKKRLLFYVDEVLNRIGQGQYFITVNIDELDKEVFDQLDEKELIIAKLKRGNNDINRFLGFRYKN